MIAVTPASMVTEDTFPALSDACSCGSWSRQGTETTRDRDWFASSCPRCVLNDGAFVRHDDVHRCRGLITVSHRLEHDVNQMPLSPSLSWMLIWGPPQLAGPGSLAIRATAFGPGRGCGVA